MAADTTTPRLKVLVADDTTANRQLMQSYLRRLGYDVVLACDGMEAIAAFKRERPDIVIMDVMMPVMDGFAAAACIKEACGNRWVPLVFLSALNGDADLVRGLEVGGDDYLVKPLSYPVLDAKLRSIRRALTLQRGLEDELKRSKAVSDVVLDAILTIDEQGVIETCNPAAERMFGYTPGQLHGQSVAVLVPPPEGAAEGSELAGFLGTDEARFLGVRREVEATRADGSRFPVELAVTELGLNGRRRFVGVVHDVSERVAAEKRLRDDAERLRAYREATERENELAAAIMVRQVSKDGLHDPRLSFSVTPAEHFSGDLVAAARSPDGALYVMLADAAGHGLAAAISVLPSLGLFYRLAAKGRPLGTMVGEINSELRAFMPVGRFVAATFLRIDEQRGCGEIWVGGTPEAWLLDGQGGVVSRFSSRHVPLGIIDTDESATETESFTWAGDAAQIVLYSDGVIEAENRAGQAFGPERLVAALSGVPGESRLACAMAALNQYLDGHPAQDDLSLMVIDCVRTAASEPLVALAG